MGQLFQRSSVIKVTIAVVVSLLLWLLPTTTLGLPNISVVEHRVIAIFALALILWFTEAIPSWKTSILIIVVLLLTCSDQAIILLQEGGKEAFKGIALSHKTIMGSFADPTIMLFLGGFVIAIMASKMGIDAQLARVLLKPFGTQSKYVLLGFIIVTGVFSMFISNTATAAMMLTFLSPVLRQLPSNNKGRIALILAIPIGANIGGIGTPVGTPPNAIALKYLNESLGFNIGFFDWAIVMMPFVILLLILSWLLLLKMFPFSEKHIYLNIEGKTVERPQLIISYITIALTILLWLTDKLTGINANTVALIPIAIFCVTGLFGKKELKELDWDVIWLVAGGFALGTALDKSGLAAHLVGAIPFEQWSPLVVIIGAGLICWLFSNIISHTATAALMIPVMVAVGTGMGSVLEPFGGILTLILCVALLSSLAMILPVSTPPNAIAFSTGMVDVKHMRTVGIIVGVIGVVLAFILLIFVGKAGIML